MKQVFTILAAVLLTATVWAQSPQKMSYQAVIRNTGDALVTNTSIGMQISILQGSAGGTAVYIERFFPTTNTNGLGSLEIGTGTVVSGDFTTIDWANGPYFIKTETDPTGGTTYTITGTSQLLSVPYALHAKTAETLSGGITETDPVFVASPANGILSGDISNWNSAFGWGNHATVGYLTSYTETDPSVPTGTQSGEMQYWNGTAWVSVAAGNEGQVLTFSGGVPTWTTTVGLNDVQNPITGEIWMDRNLGASQVAISSDDAAAYGDLYQWGRGTDGHQIRTSGITSTLSSTDNPGHSDFITNNSSPYDWRSPQNNNLWQGVSGINNPCPSDYRLPTEAELNAERTSWSSNDAAGAFASPLKLPMAGYRDNIDGGLGSMGASGVYWSSTVAGINARNMGFFNSTANMYSDNRVFGFSVRCIKD